MISSQRKIQENHENITFSATFTSSSYFNKCSIAQTGRTNRKKVWHDAD